jgi:hypothetical protein
METTNQVKKVPNPDGKGGFGDNPENRNPGGWKKEDSIGYQYRMLQRLTIEELEKWTDEHPKNIRTVAQDLAYKALIKAQKELPYLKEVTDRSEGKAPQSIDMTTNGESLNPYNALTAEELRKLAKDK